LWGGVVGLGAAIAGGLGIWNSLEWQGYRLLSQVQTWGQKPGSAWDDRLVVIAIDEASLQTYGQFNSWSRDRYRELLTTLEAAPPAAIGFDILFPEVTPADPALADAMWINGTVVLAIAADTQGNRLAPLSFLDSAAAVGHVINRPDSDGLTRSSWLYLRDAGSGQAIPNLSIAVAQVYNQSLKDSSPSPDLSSSPSPIPIPDPTPTLQGNKRWLFWPDRPETLPTYSFQEVLEGKVDPAYFANKIVIVGGTALALDPLPTPFSDQPLTSGVYLYGVLLQNLIDNSFLRTVPPLAIALGLVVLGIASVPWLQRFTTAQGEVLALVSFPVLWLTITAIAFQFHWWLPLASPVATFLAVGLLVQLKERREKQMLMYLFSQHVAPETAQIIWQRRSDICNGGELQAQELEATVLFMDVRNFTTISQKTPPTQLLHWLNRYLQAMTDCIMDQGGVVDKYIGDAIMAVFGIPIPRTTSQEVQADACRAIAASIAMYHRLQQLNYEFSQEGLPLIQFGIGIHTGRLVAGTVGSSRRLNYSVLGDTVNVAARIESLNKNFSVDNPFDLLISGRTFAYVRHAYEAKRLDAIKLKGKEAATLIYAIQGPKSVTKTDDDREKIFFRED